MSFCSLGASCLTTLAGNPRTSDPEAIFVPSVTSAFARMIERAPQTLLDECGALSVSRWSIPA